MVVELTRLLIAAERAASFTTDWLSAEKILKKQPGYLRHRLGRGVEDADTYVLEIEWESLEAHTAQFMTDPAFATFISFIKPHLACEACVMHFTVQMANGF